MADFDQENWAQEETLKLVHQELEKIHDLLGTEARESKKPVKDRTPRMPKPPDPGRRAEEQQSREEAKRRKEREREWGKSMTQMSRGMDRFGRHVGKTVSSFEKMDSSARGWASTITAAVGMTGIIGTVTGMMAGVVDRLADFQKTTVQTGFSLAGAITDVRTSMANMGMGLDDISTILEAHGTSVKFLGDNGLDATNAFIGLTNQVYMASRQFGYFGKTSQELMENLADVTGLMIIQGMTREQILDKAAKATLELNQEAAAVARLTGRSQKEMLKKSMDDVSGDGRLQQALRMMDPEAGTRLSEMFTHLERLGGGELTEFAKSFMKGRIVQDRLNITSPEAGKTISQAAFSYNGASLGPELEGIFKQFMSGSIDSRELNDAINRMAKSVDRMSGDATLVAHEGRGVEIATAITEALTKQEMKNEAGRTATQSWEKYNDALKEQEKTVALFLQGLKRFFERVQSRFSAAIMQVFGITEKMDTERVQAKMDAFADGIGDFLDKAVPALGKVFKEIMAIVGDMSDDINWGTIKEGIPLIFKTVEAIVGAFKWVYDKVSGIVDWIQGLFGYGSAGAKTGADVQKERDREWEQIERSMKAASDGAAKIEEARAAFDRATAEQIREAESAVSAVTKWSRGIGGTVTLLTVAAAPMLVKKLLATVGAALASRSVWGAVAGGIAGAPGMVGAARDRIAGGRGPGGVGYRGAGRRGGGMGRLFSLRGIGLSLAMERMMMGGGGSLSRGLKGVGDAIASMFGKLKAGVKAAFPSTRMFRGVALSAAMETARLKTGVTGGLKAASRGLKLLSPYTVGVTAVIAAGLDGVLGVFDDEFRKAKINLPARFMGGIATGLTSLADMVGNGLIGAFEWITGKDVETEFNLTGWFKDMWIGFWGKNLDSMDATAEEARRKLEEDAAKRVVDSGGTRPAGAGPASMAHTQGGDPAAVHDELMRTRAAGAVVDGSSGKPSAGSAMARRFGRAPAAEASGGTGRGGGGLSESEWRRMLSAMENTNALLSEVKTEVRRTGKKSNEYLEEMAR